MKLIIQIAAEHVLRQQTESNGHTNDQRSPTNTPKQNGYFKKNFSSVPNQLDEVIIKILSHGTPLMHDEESSTHDHSININGWKFH